MGSRRRDGVLGSTEAHQESQSNIIATRPRTGTPASSSKAARSAPMAITSRCNGESVPALGSIAEWKRSDPNRDWRHWKLSTPSAPCATQRSTSLRRWALVLGVLWVRQFTAPMACSIISQVPSPSERISSCTSEVRDGCSGSAGSP